MKKAMGLLEQIELSIQRGETVTARERFLTVATRALGREEAMRYAQIARRLNLPQLALKVLCPWVRPQGWKVSNATAEERVEYAASLTRVGAVGEALLIFDTVTPEDCWSVLLLKSFALIAQWDYAGAIPLLERYVTGAELSDYARLIGQVNLAAALIHERDPRAHAVLSEVFEAASPDHHRFLYGYAIQLKAEALIWEKRWDEARTELLRAESFFKESDALEWMFVRKWSAILDLYRGNSKSARTRLETLAKEARERRHWETVRSIDYHLAVALGDKERYARIVFGTPFEALKRRLAKDVGTKGAAPSEYRWRMGNSELSTSTPEFSMESFVTGEGAPKRGGVLARLIETLTSDFYRPFRPAEIHAQIFKGEYFNPDSSVHRVAQAVNRLRRHLEKTKSPLKVVEENGEYRLSCEGACEVLLGSSVREVSGALDWQMARLQTIFVGREFDVRAAEQALSLPNWTVKRVLRAAVESGTVLRYGKGGATRYRFAEMLRATG